MTIEETYKELANLKTQLTTKRDQEKGNEGNNTHFTKHYHNVKKWGVAFWIICLLICSFNLIYSRNNANLNTWMVNSKVVECIRLIPVFFIIIFFYSHYAIDRDDFVSYNVYHKKRIPINSIRYIELLNVSKHNSRNARFVYNKFDDFYLDSPKNIEILSDLLRINPDIEIRREM